MGRTRRAHSDEKLALKKIGLNLLKKVPIVIGKPFYYLLYFFLIIFNTLISFPKKIWVVAIIFLVLIGFYLKSTIIKDLPSPNELLTRDQDVSTKIYDRNGLLLYKIYKDKNRTLVPLGEIPLNVRLATLAAEDAEFYHHPGFSIRGIVRAIRRNTETGELTGGSTITQQLVKNSLLTPEKTLTRKIREIILSLEVEARFTKDQILEMYLNEVSYGGTAYGIQEAARLYFDKDVKDLTLDQAALLAGLAKSPTRYSPYGTDPRLSLERQKDVLNLMVINKFISLEESQEASSQKLDFAPNKTTIKAPHFVMFVRNILVDKYGEELVEKGGLEVTTTLDYSIQEMTEKIVTDEVNKLGKLKVGNGAALVMDPKTGEIFAMVGSKDYFDNQNDGNVNVVTSLRQPGSSIKIINYAYALSHGFTPASILLDAPITYSIPGSPPYSPKNYDNKFRGKLSLRNALAESRNVPAVRVLASYGVEKMIDMGRQMGITTWIDPTNYGLSLTLGGGEVKLIDLAQAYATVADYGKRPEIRSIISVKDYRGKVLEQDKCLTPKTEKIFDFDTYKALGIDKTCGDQEVLDPRVAYLLIDILRDNNARAPEFGQNSFLVILGHPEVAAKTGTSNDLRDNLTFGFNQNYLVAVWVGNNDGSSMSRIASGITGAAPIFNQIMNNLISNGPTFAWDIPKGLVQIPICIPSGTLLCNGCQTRQEWFLEENKPQNKCAS
ncbi:hypothetical protein A3D00_00810 [Candidatus Woesebacteria bacterium RIFCSPHIGHO2_02_FULL_38_9]|uniref:Uncharacterized protein n=1 Tax=Candidatus Woesebacteria bacterium RIFCSPHIGHO2_01_FULL_39_28 TaxID=1802496 RepID=A0A1F7YAS8_9BACT|nr:MAG: hypothetical protein A2627_02135 [Candidatus Woesebacteria bacterium RIFCSPHIGHO2_01_FULL_39_28]OGM33442.1 MAG: hypothetical protein A3D00_00810 [Candidatus Woesebacteria bacterium RIFCSPHIGHO2_02_FULL_38_9]OGM57268.1 MAG: hypothetical protein A3A50_00610 [Candidatus Woesebacteria bacterium RIFCSPLOWO2_01_FULL_38_20]